MKTLLIGILYLITASAYASEAYDCEDVQGRNGFGSGTLTIKTGFFSGDVKSIDLVTKIDNDKKEEVKNPFTSAYSAEFDIYPEAKSESKKHSYVKFTSGRKNTSITLSKSLIDGKNEGFAYYYSRECFILECNTYAYYFQCSKK